MKRLLLGSVIFAYFAYFVGLIHAGDATLTLDDNAGSSSFVVQDSDKTNQFKVNSDGQGYFAGNVGIGATGPGAKLEVTDSSGAGNIARFGVSATNYLRIYGTGYGYGLSTTSYNNLELLPPANSSVVIRGASSQTANLFRWENSSGTGLGAIDSSGNVGIGTTSPGQKLTVAGTIESTSGGIKFPDGTTQTTAASGSATIADSSVTTAKLKTATGEVSESANGNPSATLPGGTYGFYPQIKQTGGSNANVSLCYGSLGGTYVTNILLGQISGGATIYAQQRYVTASGKDHWLFLLLDKDTKDIIGAYSAPDHPCYGNGGDPDKVQHPFGSYDQEKHEIVIVDNETIKQLKQESNSTGKSLLTLINEEYKINKKKAEPYVPLHSGKFLTQDGKQVMQMIGKLPDYIKVRKLERLSASEKSERGAEREAAREEYEQEQQKKENNKARAMKKLKDIGLTEDEIKALLFAQK